ncbi:MAG: hypothetical protein ACNS64_05220 [Candidatus Halalkalibacterium sp. M3_1C_030]
MMRIFNLMVLLGVQKYHAKGSPLGKTADQDLLNRVTGPLGRVKPKILDG